MRKARTIKTDNYILSLSDFIERVEFLDISHSSSNFLFRGQDVRGNLLPSIARKNPRKNTTEVEKEILESIKLIGASHLNGTDDKDLDLLVLAQHFKLKTRLLDWSTNPLVALWFACAGESKGDVYVYSLDSSELLNKGVYDKNPFSLKKTCVLQPRLNNERITAQHGWFTIHRYSAKDKRFVALDQNKEIKAHLTEFTISEKSRPDILQSLDRYGINSRTLFPDLEGLCKYLNWKQELA
ncbi:Uncharacterised protein [BD1-7 clade bacterium]|nr:Uncharacterised protein [BD1-7 clade bacterium]